MGVDVSIGDEWFNYTHNVSGLWQDHLIGEDGTTGMMAIDGKMGCEAFKMMRAAISKIELAIINTYEPGNEKANIGAHKFTGRYDAKNGWGSTIGGLAFMSLVMAACAAEPNEIVHVSV